MTQDKTTRYAQTLSAMIQAETVSTLNQTDLQKFYGFHALLRRSFPHLFQVATVEEFDSSLLTHWKGADSSKQPLLLMRHHDVAEALGCWSHPPFSGAITDGSLWAVSYTI